MGLGRRAATRARGGPAGSLGPLGAGEVDTPLSAPQNMETSPALLAPPGGEQAGARSCPQGRDWDRDRLPVAAAGTAGRLGPGSSRPRSPLLRDRRRRRWAQRRHGVPQHPHPELTSAATTSSTPTRSRRQTPPRPPPFPARDPQPHPARACGPAFCAGAAAGGREEPSRVWRAGPAPRQPLRAPRGPAGWGKKPSQQHLTLRRPAGEATDSPGISVGGRRSPPRGSPVTPQQCPGTGWLGPSALDGVFEAHNAALCSRGAPSCSAPV